VALPPGITPKTVTVGIASFFDGSLAEGTATITAPVNVVHTPSNRPIFSSQMSHRFVDGETSFNLAPTDAPGLNRVDWTYKLNVVISGALVQPDPVYFTLPAAGPDIIDLDSLVTVPSSAGIPISATVVTSVNGQIGDVTVAGGDGSPTGGAGGALSGTYPDPGLNSGAVDELVAGRIADDTSDIAGALRGAFAHLDDEGVLVIGDEPVGGSGGGGAATTSASDLTSGTLAPARIADGSLPFTKMTGTLSDGQIPAGIARDTEVASAVAALVASAPGTLDTLDELAAALGDDANFAASTATAIANAKARANHTGTQAISTVTGLQTALDGKLDVDDITPATAADVAFTPTGNIGATNVQAAIAEVAAEASGSGGGGIDAGYAANQQILSKVNRALRNRIAPNTGVAIEQPTAGVYNLWQRITAGQWLRATLGTRTNTNGGVSHLITELRLATPVVGVNDNDAAITYTGTWTQGTNAGAYGGDYRYGATAGATASYTTPAATTRVGAKIGAISNGGLFSVKINGDPTRARMLPTAQDMVERGLYPNTILIANGGTLAPTDRVMDGFGTGAWDYTYLWADDLPPAAHTLLLTTTGYQRAAATGFRGYFSAFIHGQAQSIGAAGTIAPVLMQIDPGAGTSAFEYAIAGRPASEASSSADAFFGTVHDNEAETSLTVRVDGATVTPTVGAAPVVPVERATITKVSELRHPSAGSGAAGKVADVTTVYTLDRDGWHIDVDIDWTVSMRLGAAYAMMPVLGSTATSGQSGLRGIAFDRADVLENAAGPFRFTGGSDAYFGSSKSAAAWMWQSTGPIVAALYIEDVAAFTDDWVNSAGYFTSVQDRLGTVVKTYISRIGSGGINTFEITQPGDNWTWRAHYLVGYKREGADAVFSG